VKYQLFLTNAFLKKYEKLPQKIQIRVKEKLRILKDSPFVGKKLTGELTGEFSYMVGDYRIIYTIEKGEIFMEAIGHRKDIYRKSR
jgi:mRNA-degrading endonuclease RelE of RelBE toxin-antitoxin system